ncbi:unnamed protein product, partial [marine sediment metagenome]
MRESSGGRLDITLFAPGEVVPRDQGSPAVRDGALEMQIFEASADIGRLGEVTYLMAASGFPASPNTEDWMGWVYEGDGIKYMNKVWEDYGYMLGSFPGDAELFCHSNKKIQTAEDLKGLKFRTMGMWAEILEQYGVSVVTIPGGDCYSALERG